MKNTTQHLSWYAYNFLSFLIFAGILISCDNVYDDVPEKFEPNHSEKIVALNNLFQENKIDVNIRDIKPASEEVIESIRGYDYDKLSKIMDQGFYSEDIIKWNKTEVLSIDNYDMYIAITEVGESSNNGYKVLYSLMNDEGVFNQYINIIPNPELTDDTSLNEHSDLEFTLTNLDGSCLFKDKIPNAKMIAFDTSLSANSEDDGCWTSCVEETITEGSAGFLLICMATGPYCAAAIAITCAGYCVVESSDD